MILYMEPSTRSSFYYDYFYFFNIFVQQMEFICYNKYVTTLYTCTSNVDASHGTSWQTHHQKLLLYLKMQICDFLHLLQYFFWNFKLKKYQCTEKVSGIRQKNYKFEEKNFIRQKWQRKRCQDAWEGRTNTIKLKNFPYDH